MEVNLNFKINFELSFKVAFSNENIFKRILVNFIFRFDNSGILQLVANSPTKLIINNNKILKKCNKFCFIFRFQITLSFTLYILIFLLSRFLSYLSLIFSNIILLSEVVRFLIIISNDEKHIPQPFQVRHLRCLGLHCPQDSQP